MSAALLKAREALAARAQERREADIESFVQREEGLYPFLSSEHKTQLAYIAQRMMGSIDAADYSVLRERRDEILSWYERRYTASEADIAAVHLLEMQQAALQ